MDFQLLLSGLTRNWHIWLVTITLVVAAYIDGKQLKVPNWITFPMILSGWVFNTAVSGWEGLGLSLLGTAVGLALLLPAYAIGGMGAGDVKLLAGVGAWVGSGVTFYAFCLSAIVGGVIAVAMVVCRRGWTRHKNQFLMILNEIATVGSPSELATIAAERKSSMLLLPYGIPIAIGTILYFFWAGMLV
ncbi:MAG TPA: A24 family peptidase [Pirellulales bacterium]|jgi:prepilin peptidase CpaA|nr:A24 family peptidase [Pirellulales bacterium]